MAVSNDDTSSHQILIVDDSPMSLRLLTQIISMHGYRTKAVAGGIEALQAAQADPPDLILLDIMMPELNGYQVAQRLQANPQTAEIPIIFISALSDEKNKVDAFEAGGVDYVSKPLHVQEVIARVGTHLRLRDASRHLQQELAERERLIAELDAVNERLEQEIAERRAAQEAREAALRVTQQALARAEALHRIARSLITSEDIPEMLETVATSAAQALPADRVLVVALNQETEQVTHYAMGGAGAACLQEPLYEELMDGLTGWVVQRVQPVLSPKGQPDPRESVAARRRREAAQCGGIVVVPLYYQGTMLGTITAINRPDQVDFGEQHLAQLNAVAGQLSVALANARLSEETAYLKEYNEGIVQGVAEAILVMDQGQRVTFANPAAAAMLGYAAPDLIGQSSSVLFADDQYDTIRTSVLGGAAGGTARFETVLRNREGDRVPALASIRPLYQGNELVGSLAALTDITDIKEAEARLRRYAADLEARNSELDAFAHTVAHDLRSPLTGFMGFVDLLRAAIPAEEKPMLGEYLQYLDRNSAKMNNIIDELLLLSSVREMDEVDVRPLDMAQIVREARSRLNYLIEEAGAEVTQARAWPMVMGYPQWIEEVWVNYLSNAVKYGGKPEAGTLPRVELGYDLRAGDDHVRFWVRDNGPGLTGQQQEQLFTPFERLHNVRAEGHGLGLSIVRRILEKLDGTVGVESTPGMGSTFYFTLPRA